MIRPRAPLKMIKESNLDGSKSVYMKVYKKNGKINAVFWKLFKKDGKEYKKSLHYPKDLTETAFEGERIFRLNNIYLGKKKPLIKFEPRPWPGRGTAK